MKKKIVALLLCVCMIVPLFAGCSGSADTNECLGSWKLSDGGGAADSAISTEATGALTKLGLSTDDVVVLTISEDQTYQEYMSGAFISGTWILVNSKNITLEKEVFGEKVQVNVHIEGDYLVYDLEGGDKLYFEKSERNANTMYQAFTDSFKDVDSLAGVFDKVLSSTASAAALVTVQTIVNGEEALMDTLFTAIGEIYDGLDASTKAQIESIVKEYVAIFAN